MNNLQLTLLVSLIVSFFVSIILYFILNKWVVEKQYHKFYPAPIVPLFLSVKNNCNYNKVEVALIMVLYQLIYAPLTVVWFLAWCIYKLLFLHTANVVEYTSQEEIEEDESINLEVPAEENIPVWAEKPEDL